MKIIVNDDINMIIFLNNEYLNKHNYNDDDLESYFKELFLTLKNIYEIEISGYYNIDVYIDKKYGVILELEKEELEYLDYYDNQVDMCITIHNSNFLYCLNDIDFFNQSIYVYKNKIYGLLNEEINNYEMGLLMEYSEIEYKNGDNILKYGKRLEV